MSSSNIHWIGVSRLTQIFEPGQEISNNVVFATSKASDQVWSEPLLVAWIVYDC